VHNASDAFTVISADGLVRYQSPAVEQVLGYPREELIGRALLDLVHPITGRRLSDCSSDPRSSVTPQPCGWRGADASRRDESRPKRFEMTITDLLHDPTPTAWCSTTGDITERALYQEQLTQQAFHDPPTGLPNRARFRSGWSFALQALRWMSYRSPWTISAPATRH
jgi:PAS domain S-box-containing protein